MGTSPLTRCPHPLQVLLALSVSRLRACGLSGSKVLSLQDLARHFAAGLVDPAAWTAMEDEAVIADLVRIRGIGRWSAEMFLIFHLLRPDVLPLADAGLRRALAQADPALAGADVAAMRQRAEIWRPWRSVATWLLWRSLDPVSVEY